MKIRVERLKSADWQAFYCLFKQLLEEDFSVYSRETKERFADKVKEAFEETKRSFWVAKIDGKIVGFLVAKGTPDGVSFINWLGVVKEFRRQDVGIELVRTWERWFKKKGYHKLRAAATNRENQPFYEKLGFSLEGVMKKDAYGADRLVLGKIIR